MLKAKVIPYTLDFAFTAYTSRETFTHKPTFFIEIFDETNPLVSGRGEVAVFPSLQPSFKGMRKFIEELQHVAINIDYYAKNLDSLPLNSAIRFGVEMALADLLNGGLQQYQSQAILNNLKQGIRINGLVWMNDFDTMLHQIDTKINEGFRCIKLKIGAIDFESEIDMLRHIRNNFNSNKLEIRVDANGAWEAAEAMKKLDRLSHFDISSIEQPIRKDNTSMPQICRESPIPVALDEDMIERWWKNEQKSDWLNKISPTYIVLKPSLVGGFEKTKQWIKIAENSGIGWWVTSALESNLGLSAIAQFMGNFPNNLNIAHGLGTGKIYTNNIEASIHLEGERLFIN